MTKLYAQPYDISATGFYFETLGEYAMSAMNNRNQTGGIVEEYEIQFIDGDLIDCELAKAWGLYQSNFAAFLEAAENWDDEQKTRYIIAVEECGYSHDQVADNPDDIEIDIYEMDSLKELAEHFVDEGLFGDIPERLEFYLDYEAMGRDLGFDYTKTTINSTNLIYRCA